MPLSLPSAYQRKPGHTDAPAKLRWKEGNIAIESDEGLLAWGDGPFGEGWLLFGAVGDRTLIMFVYSKDETQPIAGEIFKNGDNKSNFTYSDSDNGEHEGDYSFKLNLTHDPLTCTATFKHSIPSIGVEITDGTFDLT